MHALCAVFTMPAEKVQAGNKCLQQIIDTNGMSIKMQTLNKRLCVYISHTQTLEKH